MMKWDSDPDEIEGQLEMKFLPALNKQSTSIKPPSL